jgi:hypothetical protein
MKSALIIIFLMFLSLNTYAIGGDNAGNGGDNVAIEFESSFHRALQNIKSLQLKGFEDISKIDFGAKMNNLKIIVVDDPLTVNIGDATQDCVAVNFPSKNLIRINRSNWNSISNAAIKEGLALHEMLSLFGLEESGVYRYSSRYLSAYSLDPDAIYKKFPVHTGDLEILKISDDTVPANRIMDFILKQDDRFEVSVKVLTVFVGGAAGMSKLVLNLYDDSNQNGGDVSHFVSYEVDYVDEPPKKVSFMKVSADIYKLVLVVKAVTSFEDSSKHKLKTVTAEIHLDQNRAISEVKFKE